MANLSVRTPDGKVRTVPLLKRITSVGRGPDNDVQLDDPAVPDSALHVLFDGSRYQVGSSGATFQINGKKRDSHVLASQDVIRVGGTELTFSREDAPAPRPTPPPPAATETHSDSHTSELPGVPGRELVMLRRLTTFSERLLGSYDLDRTLESLMDEVIEVTRADKGFLILMESNEPRVKVARNLSRENIEDAVEKLSDSIISKVVKDQKPLIIADAIDTPEFKASESVVNLKVHSVMCVPLMHKGDLFGVIYVGNDRLVNRFEPKSLDMLTVFAAQASSGTDRPSRASAMAAATRSAS